MKPFVFTENHTRRVLLYVIGIVIFFIVISGDFPRFLRIWFGICCLIFMVGNALKKKDEDSVLTEDPSIVLKMDALGISFRFNNEYHDFMWNEVSNVKVDAFNTIVYIHISTVQHRTFTICPTRYSIFFPSIIFRIMLRYFIDDKKKIL